MVSDHVAFSVDAPVEDVWRVIGTRWADVHLIIDRISASRLVDGEEPATGCSRQCTLAEPVMGLTAVRERIVAWEPPHEFAYEMLDPPFPLARMGNRWRMEADGDGTRLTLTPDLTLRGRWMTRWLEGFVLRRLMKDLEDDVAHLKVNIEREARRPE